MKRWLIGVAAGMVTTAGACGGRAMPEGADGVTEPPLGAECPVRSGVDGVTCYPTNDLGREARGEAYGDRLANLEFIGLRPDGNGKIDPDGPLSHVQTADYFDPTGEVHSLLVINACTRWCWACNALADDVSKAESVLASKGIVFLEAVVEGVDYKPSTIADLRSWVADHAPSFTVVADSDGRLLGNYDGRQAWPFLVYVDPRTMEIVAYESGAPNDLVGHFEQVLTDLRKRPAKP